MVEGEVVGGLGLARAGELDGTLDGGRVEAELLWAAALPVRVAAGRVRLRGEEVGGSGEEGGDEGGGAQRGSRGEDGVGPGRNGCGA